jgi:glutamyl-tRNA synthetase
LRIEDTDEARSTKDSEQGIITDFAWLNFHFDEGVMPDGSEKGQYGPYRQTACAGSYENHLRRLISENKAYYCFCSKEELEAQRLNSEAAGIVAKYSGKCRSVTASEAESRIANGAAPIVRLKVPSGKKKFHDLIRGDIEFDLDLMGDFVIARSVHQALYNFAVVVDDATMQITQAIRGEEHISNTPKQMLIAEALGVASPEYAHVPVILSATGKGKMSKRDGGTTIKEYRDAGYLPEAMINFLALLGWHPVGDKQEIMSFDDIAKEFTLERVQKGGAAFNKVKLDFFNAHYIKQLPVSQLVGLLADEKFSDSKWQADAAFFAKVVAVSQDRLVTLADFKVLAEPIFNLPTYDAQLLAWKKSTPASARENLIRIKDLLIELPEQLFTKESLEPKVMEVAEKYGRGDVLWPLRVALSGKDSSPPPVDLLAVLGKTESLARITKAINAL